MCVPLRRLAGRFMCNANCEHLRPAHSQLAVFNEWTRPALYAQHCVGACSCLMLSATRCHDARYSNSRFSFESCHVSSCAFDHTFTIIFACAHAAHTAHIRMCCGCELDGPTPAYSVLCSCRLTSYSYCCHVQAAAKVLQKDSATTVTLQLGECVRIDRRLLLDRTSRATPSCSHA